MSKNHSKAVETANPVRKRKAHSGAKRSVDTPVRDTVCEAVRNAINRKELKAKTTLGFYSVKSDDSLFGVPFCALNDHYALLAIKQVAPLANVYKIGSVCLCDGSVRSCKPYVLLDKGVVHE